MSPTFHDEASGSDHWSDTKYYPSFMFTRTVINGVRPVLGKLTTANENSVEAVAGFEVTAIPNPFNPSTVIRVNGAAKPVSISIYDISGRCVAKFNNMANHSITWNAQGLGSGVYLLKAVSGKSLLTRTLFLNK